MTPTKIYIPVSVEQELPPFPMIVTVLLDGRLPMMAQIRPHETLEKGHEWWTLGMSEATRIEEKKKCITHWLKPVERYIFTKEELEKVVGDAMDKGEASRNTTTPYSEIKEDYLENIFNQSK